MDFSRNLGILGIKGFLLKFLHKFLQEFIQTLPLGFFYELPWDSFVYQSSDLWRVLHEHSTGILLEISGGIFFFQIFSLVLLLKFIQRQHQIYFNIFFRNFWDIQCFLQEFLEKIFKSQIFLQGLKLHKMNWQESLKTLLKKYL